MMGDITDPHPTVLGLLCLGLSPADNIPGAYVQFLRLAGKDLDSAVLDQAEIHGHVADLIRPNRGEVRSTQSDVRRFHKPSDGAALAALSESGF